MPAERRFTGCWVDTRRRDVDIEAALVLEPEMAMAWRQKALLSRAQGAWDEALAAVNKLIELEPDDGAAYVLRAEINDEGFEKILQGVGRLSPRNQA